MDTFNLDLSLVARLGGHSQPRTHRGKERFPGMTITYALIQMLEKVEETTDKARIITKAKVFELLMNNGCVLDVFMKKVARMSRKVGQSFLLVVGSVQISHQILCSHNIAPI